MEISRSLQLQAALYRDKLKAIEALDASVEVIRETLELHPDLWAAFDADFQRLARGSAGQPLVSTGGHPANPVVSQRDRAGTDPAHVPTTLSKIIDFLRSRDNAPTSMAEILDNVPSNPVTIKTILYKRGRHRFKMVHIVGEVGAYWQLADPAHKGVLADGEDPQLELPLEVESDQNTTAPGQAEGGS